MIARREEPRFGSVRDWKPIALVASDVSPKRWAFGAGLTIAVALAFGPQALAARLPTHTEAKALQRAFNRDPQRPDHAAITLERVSTVNEHWASVQFAAPEKASATRPASDQAKRRRSSRSCGGARGCVIDMN